MSNERIQPESTAATENRIAFLLMLGAGEALSSMQEVWRRPVRHNMRIEQDALTDTTHVLQDCRLLIAQEGGAQVRMSHDPHQRYEVEAAIRTIPALVPFTAEECRNLRENETRVVEHDMYVIEYPRQYQYLVERWHKWLWSPKEPGSRAQSPNPDAELLAYSYERLANALNGIFENG
ncbi:MAG TPA: hypothetical protein VMD79_12405 [Solirubrobacteraceae bacterium]|nr:hypothetical protein [Solirubrobacteraceae bacterium]